MELELELSNDSSDSSDSESESPGEVSDTGLNVSSEEIERNLALLGSRVVPDPSTLKLSELRIKHPNAFSPDSEALLAKVLNETILPFASLSDFQV